MLPNLVIAGLCVLALGCHPRRVTQPAELPLPSFSGSKLRSFTDTLPVTAIADAPNALFVGTPRGLVRWDTSNGRYTLLTQKDGLPADRVTGLAVDAQGGVWVATPKGIAREQGKAWRSFPSAPVGSFLTGLLPSADGRMVWAGGPEGLARLRNGRWEPFLADLGVTALVPGAGGAMWVGSSGLGVLRIARGGDKIERFAAAQGCEADVVRGIAADARGLLVVGEGERGPRAAFFDGTRFYSYKLDSPQVIEWAASAGEHASARMFLGAGEHMFEIVDGAPNKPTGPVQLSPLTASAQPPRARVLKPELTAQALEEGAQATRAPASQAGRVAGPLFATEEAPLRLPDGVTTIAGSPRGLLVGTRFLGAERIENGVPRLYRLGDLTVGSSRLTVACVNSSSGEPKKPEDAPGKPRDECYVATGGTRAFSFDGQAFEVAPIDPEADSRVLAVLRDPSGNVMAIHRGALDSHLRISRVDGGRWTPIAFEAVEVPEGVPELNFADFSPDGHLWVGLRYVDKERDARDYGAAEILLDSGKVVAHRQGDAAAQKAAAGGNGVVRTKADAKAPAGFVLPNEVVAMYWKSAREGWFATRAGALRLYDGKLRVFTENDGLASELTTAIGPGPKGEIWLATGRGTGRFDGTRWLFPKVGAFYPRATALGHDAHGNVFVGTVKGLYCVGACPPDVIDHTRGLIDDAVVDLAVDPRGRVWVLTEKGITIVEP
jgi:sugar lactone lactonase YvrE